VFLLGRRTWRTVSEKYLVAFVHTYRCSNVAEIISYAMDAIFLEMSKWFNNEHRWIPITSRDSSQNLKQRYNMLQRWHSVGIPLAFCRSFKSSVLQKRWVSTHSGMQPRRWSRRLFSWPRRWKAPTRELFDFHWIFANFAKEKVHNSPPMAACSSCWVFLDGQCQQCQHSIQMWLKDVKGVYISWNYT
jgi:hypothetical protein